MPSFSVFINRLWNELMFTKIWICKQIANRRVFSSKQTESGIVCQTAYVGKHVRRLDFGNICILDQLFSGKHCQKHVFFDASIIARISA